MTFSCKSWGCADFRVSCLYELIRTRSCFGVALSSILVEKNDSFVSAYSISSCLPLSLINRIWDFVWCWRWFRIPSRRTESWKVWLVNIGLQSSIEICVKLDFVILVRGWNNQGSINSLLGKCNSVILVFVIPQSISNFGFLSPLVWLVVRWPWYTVLLLLGLLKRNVRVGNSGCFEELSIILWQCCRPVYLSLINGSRNPSFLFHYLLSKTRSLLLVWLTKWNFLHEHLIWWRMVEFVAKRWNIHLRANDFIYRYTVTLFSVLAKLLSLNLERANRRWRLTSSPVPDLVSFLTAILDRTIFNWQWSTILKWTILRRRIPIIGIIGNGSHSCRFNLRQFHCL